MKTYREAVRVYQDKSSNWVLLRCVNDLPIYGIAIPLGEETTVKEDAAYLFDEERDMPERYTAISPVAAAKWSIGKDPMLEIEWPDGRFIRNVSGEGAEGYISSWEASEQDA